MARVREIERELVRVWCALYHMHISFLPSSFVFLFPRDLCGSAPEEEEKTIQ